jgi:hypothetical protein
MNFRTALSELCNGQNDIGELARRNHLNTEQVMALKAVSGKCSEAAGMTLPSAFIASMMA